MDTPSFHLQQHLDTLYTRQPRQLAFRATSVDEFAAWQNTFRAKIREILGIGGRALPQHVSAQLVQSVDRGSYVEEKYALDVGESLPAPMYLLVPKTAPPYKTILAFHGHNPSVQYIIGNYPNEEAKQKNYSEDGNWAQVLAQAGYLVCAVEQRGFGERLSNQLNAPTYPISCRHLSFEYLLEGRTMLGERCWDGMVALTYLLNREDVIKETIGCSGHSGGATTALWLSAIDERIGVVVPSCYLCTLKDSILGMEHCECNYVPHILEYGELGDVAALIAPRPMHVIAGEKDPIFPIGGVYREYETLQKAYGLLGVEDRLSLTVHPGAHAYHHASSGEWFKRWM